VITVLANQKEWKVISSHNLHEKIYATPAIEDGRLYFRTDKAFYCFTKAAGTPARTSGGNSPTSATAQ